MEHIQKTTTPLTDFNIEGLYKLCPSAFTEVQGDDGKLTKKVDFAKLRELLGDFAFDDAPEVYDFTWVGKRAAMREAAAPIRKTLRPCPEESVDWDTTQNLYIEGDNLEVLKLLQNSYMGKVKMIYIDPPYNTGNDFIYLDNYSVSEKEYELNYQDEDGNKFSKNLESSGRFHSKWCSNIYERLLVARNFLAKDGVIFISIDEHEVNTLKAICNEVFYESNFVGTLVIQTATDNNPGQIKMQHEYMLCYTRGQSKLKNWAIESEKAKLINQKYLELKEELSSVKDIQENLRAWIKANKEALKGVTHYDNVDEKGVFHDGDIANTVFGGYEYDIIHPITGKVCKMPEKGYRFTEETMTEMLKNNDVMFGDDERTLPKPKIRVEDAKELLRSVIYEDGRSSTKKFEALMARDIFQNPKSETIISRLIEYVAEPGDIVMDFFSGSGTTAEATFITSLKIPSLRFIMIQYPEDLDKSKETASSKAKKTINNAIKFLDSIGKQHTIPEIGKERIRRAGKKIKDENPEATKDLDIGFRVFKCDESNYKETAFSPKDYSQESLDLWVDNIKEDRSGIDLLFDCMLRWGVELSLPIETTKVEGCTIYNVNDGGLVACFEGVVTEKVIDTIAALDPAKVVFRDSSFTEASTKMNLYEQFKQKCGWDEADIKKNIRVI